MKALLHRIFLVLTCLLVPVNALSDEVFLKNGDRLSGKVVSKSGDKLVFKTDYAGKINIQWADISHLTTDKPVRITLDDKTDLTGILSVTDGTELRIAADADAEPEPLPMQQIAAINLPEAPRFKFTGQINAGFERDRGNTDEDDYHLDAETRLRWPDDRLTFSFDGDLEKSNNKKTKQEADLIGRYDHFLTEKWYLTSGLMFEHDKFADLDLRTTIGVGPGHQFLETDRTNLSVELGPGYVWENFDDSEDQDYAVGLWGLRFDHYLFEKWKLQAFHNHRFTLSLEDSDDYIFKSKTGLRVPIIDNLQATLQFNFDRDNAPADDSKKNDFETLVTGGYTW